MPKLKRRRVDTEIEKRILIGMITSTKFLRDVIPALNYSYFQIEYSRKVASWVSDYFQQYGEAPGRHIEDIFRTKEWDQSLKENEIELVEDFLGTLSNKYEEESLNSDYLLDKAFGYFKERALAITSENMKILLGAGKVKEAEQQLIEYKQVSRITSGWINPFDPSYMEKVFEEKEDYMFSLPGILGEKFGGFRRGWLVAFLAPYKRGKTWMLQEMAMQAIFKRLKVVLITLEMSDQEMADRIYKRVTGAASEGRRGAIYPAFDCLSNQDGSCKKKERENRVQLYDADGNMPIFDLDNPYRICVACRGRREYVSALWVITTDYKSLTLKRATKATRGLSVMYGDGFRIISYPRFSANLTKVKSDLDILEHTEDFIPDVIVVDYADILAPEDDRITEGRERTDETWKSLANLAGTRYCLVVTVSQSTRASIEKKNVTQTDTAEDIRKQAHVDVMFALSQLREEKRQGIMRVSLISHRHRLFDELDQVTILQNLEVGQPILDGEMM